MKGFLSIDGLVLGEVDLKVMDRSMTVIGGDLHPNKHYDLYRDRIYDCFEAKGVANVDDFDFVFTLNDGTRCEPEGGIGVYHSREFPDKIEVDVAGVGDEVVKCVDTN